MTLEGAIAATATIEVVTDDHAAAARGANLVFIPLPAPAQPAVIDRIAPVLAPGQIVCGAKGTFGALCAGRRLERAGVTGVPVAEMPVLPYGVRLSGPASVRLALVASHLPLGVYPSRATAAAAAAIRPAYPAVSPVEDALSSTLCNIDPALHAPLVCMNAGAIEGLESFDIHVQGSTPAVIATSLALDEERLALREALGYPAPHWPLAAFYEGGETFYASPASCP